MPNQVLWLHGAGKWHDC